MNIQSPPENIMFEDDEAIVVLAYDPISLGHVVIKPKAAYKDIDELPLDLLHKLMHLAQVYVRLLKQAYASNGYSIMQNGGMFNDTGHFHLHVFQRESEAQFSWTYAEEIDPELLKFESIRDSLKEDFHRILLE